MKLITRFELASKATSELYALHRDMLNAFACCKAHSAEQRTCLASLAISKTRSTRERRDTEAMAQPLFVGCTSLSELPLGNQR